MENDDLIVLGETNIKFDAVALALGGVESLHGVFNGKVAVESAVGIVHLEGLDRGLGLGTGTEKENVKRGKRNDCNKNINNDHFNLPHFVGLESP